MESNWDYYLCRVDDQPASILLDFALADAAPVEGETTLYAVFTRMREAGPHGMGLGVELEALEPAEDAIEAAASERGVRHVGRLRGDGTVQWTFMGPPGLEGEMKRIASSAFDGLGRDFDLHAQDDPDWSYYREFLFPSPERIQWILDRRLVDALRGHGDDLTRERRVDHWAFIDDATARAKFVEQATTLGFDLVPRGDDDDESAVRLHRVDPVDLEHIHDVADDLRQRAEACGGDYDGWETSVEKE